jgi:hypothetical protein
MRQRAYQMIALAGVLALSAAAQVVGCNLDLSVTNGTCTPDTNPCTEDICSNGQPIHIDLADGTTCTRGSNAGTCQMGNCELDCNKNDPPNCACETVADCQAPKDECETWTCANKTCKRDYPQGNLVAMQIPGDCLDIVCDGMGTKEAVVNDMDVPAQTDCITKTCNMGTITSEDKLAETTCQNGFCDGMGNCVQCVMDSNCGTSPMYCNATMCFSCESGAQDGDETGVDCGGHFCGACNGEPCTAMTDCVSNHCADNVCCNAACNQNCESCDITGMLGSCLPDPQYTADCASGQACNASGACAQFAGETCTSASDCAGGDCTNGTCVHPLGAPCTSPDHCTTKFCDSFKCASCQNTGDCPNGLTCNTTTGICG